MKQDILKIAIMVLVLPVVLLGMVLDLPGASVQVESTGTTVSADSTAPTVSASTMPSQITTAPTASTVPTVPTVPPTAATPTQPETTSPPAPTMISVSMDGQVRQMDMEEYVLGVVLAEMPASFHMEALKAQAVACRSYALMGCIGRGNHKEGFVCTSPGCCQAYRSPEAYIQDGGRWENVQRVWAAVQATQGQILMHGGNLVLATYFSCSGGKTEAAITVFGVNYPYLQAVESPGEEFAGVYEYTETFTPGQFALALKAELSGSPAGWIGEVTYTQGGGVNTVMIGNVQYDGLTVKRLLGLRSTIFTIEVAEDAIVIRTQGYGHRVGMSQYGAQAMAENGSSYLQILSHYYIGTSVEQFATIF